MAEYTFLPMQQDKFIHPAQKTLRRFRKIVRANESNRNLGVSLTMKSLLDETFPDHEIFFFSPLSYFKNIKDIEKPTFWVLTTRNLVPSEGDGTAPPDTISYGFALPSDDDWYGADLGVKILWLNTLVWGKKSEDKWTGLHRRPNFGDADPILSKMAQDFHHPPEDYHKEGFFNREVWEKEGYWTKANFQIKKIRSSSQYTQKFKLFVMPLAPRESVGLVNWMW